MNGYHFGVGPAVAVLCLGLTAAATTGPVAALALAGGLAAAAAVLGLLIHGGEHPGRWRWSWALLTVGLVASVGGALLGSVAGAGGRTAGDVVALLGAVCSVVGLVRLLQQRLGARSADVIFEAVMTAAGVGFVVGTLVLRPGEATGTLDGGRPRAPVGEHRRRRSPSRSRLGQARKVTPRS